MTTLTHWKGHPIDYLTRDELVEALTWAAEQVELQRAELMLLQQVVDPLSYFGAKMMQQAVKRHGPPCDT